MKEGRTKIKCTFTEDMLGTASSDPEVHSKHIASKSADKEKMKEELASLPADELLEKSMTVLHRFDEDGNPFIYDYQFKGFIKEALGVQVEFGKMEIKAGRKKASISKWTYKRIVDNFVFVYPRKIRLNFPEGKTLEDAELCTRPLRADTMRGERVALATSETVPVGTTFECEVEIDNPLLVKTIEKCLDYGAKKGIGQWRNSGKGRFDWEEVEEDA